LIEKYDGYYLTKFFIPVGQLGDCFDRYKVRMEEMRQSSEIIFQIVDYLFDFIGKECNFLDNNKIVPPTRP
jgi:NADH-quinone oxidoreductase subunit D